MESLQFGDLKLLFFRLDLNESKEGFCQSGKRRSFHVLCRWTKNRKGAETSSEESGGRNLEPESIISRAFIYR